MLFLSIWGSVFCDHNMHPIFIGFSQDLESKTLIIYTLKLLSTINSYEMFNTQYSHHFIVLSASNEILLYPPKNSATKILSLPLLTDKETDIYLFKGLYTDLELMINQLIWMFCCQSTLLTFDCILVGGILRNFTYKNISNWTYEANQSNQLLA